MQFFPRLLSREAKAQLDAEAALQRVGGDAQHEQTQGRRRQGHHHWRGHQQREQTPASPEANLRRIVLGGWAGPLPPPLYRRLDVSAPRSDGEPLGQDGQGAVAAPESALPGRRRPLFPLCASADCLAPVAQAAFARSSA